MIWGEVNKPIAIVGPTASGKTQLSLYLAEKIKAEIISADSRQIYRFLDIGTAKPTKQELKKIKHHFIDILNPDEEYNAGKYGINAREKIAQLQKVEKPIIVVGGSGLYIKSLVDGLFEGPGKDKKLRDKYESILQTEGVNELLAFLKNVDPITAGSIDLTKPRRIIRALEVFYSTGKPLSTHHKEQQKKPLIVAIHIGLLWKREELYKRIERRVETMMKMGLLDEVQSLKEKGYDTKNNSLNTVGYKECFQFLEGNISKEEMVKLIKKNTCRYAKRQMTWFTADKRIQWTEVDENLDYSKIINQIDFQNISC
jgi:tRNA dimethylallyltransferase